MPYEQQRYTAVIADESRGLVWMLGTNGVGGPIDLAVGPTYTPRADRRRFYVAGASIHRLGGLVVSGIQLSLVTLTGIRGDLWLSEVVTGIQGGGARVRFQGVLPVGFGMGVMASRGSLVTDDVLQIEGYYD